MAKDKVFFPNLDGLRFYCFLSVFLFHSFFTISNELVGASTLQSPVYHFLKRLFENGSLGVNFFFVLSGFLITYLLIREKQKNGRIDIRNFYIRRVLRIWPLYYACVIFGFFIFPIVFRLLGRGFTENADITHYLVFTTNFDFLKGPPNASTLGVLWSVAIEEQFYLIWPIILNFIPFKYYKWVFLTIIIYSLAYRFTHDSVRYLEFSTFSVISDMAIGAWAAYASLFSSRFFLAIKKLSKLYIFILYLCLIAVFLYCNVLFDHFVLRLFERVIVAAIFVLVILEQNFSENSLFKMGNFKQISKLGKITYGLYCLHYICLLTIAFAFKFLHINNYLFENVIIIPAFSLISSILVSSISYKYFETPFLKLKRRFEYITTRI